MARRIHDVSTVACRLFLIAEALVGVAGDGGYAGQMLMQSGMPLV